MCIVSNLNSLRLDLVHKRQFCKILKSNFTLEFLKTLLKHNLIKEFSSESKYYYKYSWKKYKKFIIVKQLTIFYKSASKLTIKHSTLRHKYSHPLYFILTHKGILSNKSTLKYGIGGILLCKIIV